MIAGSVEDWREADASIARIQRQRASLDVTLTGRNHMSSDEKNAVRSWIDASEREWLREIAGKNKNGSNDFEYLLLRFGEMVRRIGNYERVESADDDVVRSVLCLRYYVLLEMYNITQGPPKNLAASALLYAEDDLTCIPDEPEFAWCDDAPWIIRHAITSYPTDPRGFLRRVRIAIDDIRNDPAFEWCHGLDGFLYRAAVNHFSNPKKYLLNLMRTRDEILTEEEFSWAKEKKYLVLSVCSLNKDPRSKLRRAHASAEALCKDPSLARFPSKLKEYACFQADDAASWLLDYEQRCEAIRNHPDCAWLQENEFLISYVARTYPRTWHVHIRRAKATYDAILQDSNLQWCHAHDGAVKDLVVKHPDYHEMLTRAATIAEKFFGTDNLNEIFSDGDASQDRLFILKKVVYEQEE